MAIPVFNRVNLIIPVVASALEQTLDEGWQLEVLVVDNASSDGTFEAVAALSDPRVRLVRNEHNLGLFGNFNRCRELATGEFLRYLCSDDFLLPGCLREELRLLCASPSAAMLTTPVRSTEAKVRPSRPAFAEGLVPAERAHTTGIVELAAGRNAFNFPSGILVRRSAARAASAFDESLLGVADVDYWLQLLEQGDLLVSSSPGCLVTEHHGRASYELFYQGSFMRGQIALVEKWSTRRPLAQALADQCRQTLAARCYWYVVSCIRARQFRGALRHVRIAWEHRLTPPIAMRGLIRLVRQRLSA